MHLLHQRQRILRALYPHVASLYRSQLCHPCPQLELAAELRRQRIHTRLLWCHRLRSPRRAPIFPIHHSYVPLAQFKHPGSGSGNIPIPPPIPPMRPGSSAAAKREGPEPEPIAAPDFIILLPAQSGKQSNEDRPPYLDHFPSARHANGSKVQNSFNDENFRWV
jgi:hypothetical protein